MSAVVLDDKLAGWLAEQASNPRRFVEDGFDWGRGDLADCKGPYAWQAQVLDEIGEKLRSGQDLSRAVLEAVASGHGIGKSALVAWIVLWAIATCVDARGVVTANTEAQLTTKTWPEVQKWHRMSLVKDRFAWSATALYSNEPGHEKTWRFDALPWSEHRPEAFAGLHNAGRRIALIFDEASAIPDKIWEVAEGALTDKDTEILWLAFGNPTRATGRFRECFRKFAHRWSTRNIDSRTVDGTNKEQIAKWVVDYGEDSDFVKVRVRGLFPAQSAKQFISEADVDAAYGRHLPPQAYSWAPKIITVDPAWSGDDSLVISLRQGLAFKVLRSIPKNDNDIEVANIVAQLDDELSADAVFIDMGWGTGIYSAGKTWKRNHWRLVNFGDKATDAGCLNKRAEMWKRARDWLKDGGCLPPDPELRDDLLGPETVARMDGKLQLESKEDMKARGLKSPNKGDTLAMSFAYDVRPRTVGQALEGLRQSKCETEYNPLERA